MNQDATVAIVTQKAINEAPIAIQKFVERFFEKSTFFGIDCWVAFEELSYSGKERGVAPRHHGDVRYHLNEYGKTKGDELYKHWEKITEDPTKCFNFHKNWDDGCCGPPMDAD